LTAPELVRLQREYGVPRHVHAPPEAPADDRHRPRRAPRGPNRAASERRRGPAVRR
jgi:hypothetical protein